MEEGSDEEGEKRKHEDSELEEDLSDDDYALIEENLGIRVDRSVSGGLGMQFGLNIYSQNALHSWPSGASYGVSFVSWKFDLHVGLSLLCSQI